MSGWWNTVRFAKFFLELVKRLPFWAPAGRVETIKVVGRGIVNDGKQIAANAVASWLHEAERSIGCNRRVHCASSIFQYVERNLGCQWVGCRCHAVAGIDRTAGPLLSNRATASSYLLFHQHITLCNRRIALRFQLARTQR